MISYSIFQLNEELAENEIAYRVFYLNRDTIGFECTGKESEEAFLAFKHYLAGYFKAAGADIEFAEEASVVRLAEAVKEPEVSAEETISSAGEDTELDKDIVTLAKEHGLAEVAEQINTIGETICKSEETHPSDMLAAAKSVCQKLLQSVQIKRTSLQEAAYLKLAFDAEDDRNILMQAAGSELLFLSEDAESADCLTDVKDGLYAICVLSLAEALAYLLLEEKEAAKSSLRFFAAFLEKTFLQGAGELFAEDFAKKDRNAALRALTDLVEQFLV